VTRHYARRFAAEVGKEERSRPRSRFASGLAHPPRPRQGLNSFSRAIRPPRIARERQLARPARKIYSRTTTGVTSRRSSAALPLPRLHDRLYSVLSRKGKLRHAPAKTRRGLRIPPFSLAILSAFLIVPPPPTHPASVDPERMKIPRTSAVGRQCQPARETVIRGSVLPRRPFSVLFPEHEFVQSGSLTAASAVFAFIRIVNARDTATWIKRPREISLSERLTPKRR